MSEKLRAIKVALWNLSALACFGFATYYNHQDNTIESTWWNVMAFGTLMLVRTEKRRMTK